MNSSRGLILKTMLPVAIGAAVVIWLFCREFTVEQWLAIPWTVRTFGAIALGALCIIGREWGMMWRFRTLSDRRLTWRQTLKITMQCEFTSAITPTTAGGSTLSMVFLSRQGIPLGRATIITLIVLMLDELFIVVACPIIFLLFPGHAIFGFDPGAFTTGVRLAFWIVYGGVCALTLVLFLGAFFFQGGIARTISRIFVWRPLRRWHSRAVETGQTMISAGRDLRSRPLSWWAEALGATALSWISRYLVVNAQSAYKEEIGKFFSLLLNYDNQFQVDEGSVRTDVIRDSVYYHPWRERYVLLRSSDAENRVITDLTLKPDGSTYLEEYLDFVESCRPVPYIPMQIRLIVQEEAHSFFEGSKGAVETAEAIQSRVQLYLEEKK